MTDDVVDVELHIGYCGAIARAEAVTEMVMAKSQKTVAGKMKLVPKIKPLMFGLFGHLGKRLTVC